MATLPSSRRAFGRAAIISLLLHAVAAWWLWRQPRHFAPPNAQTTPIELEVRVVETPRPARPSPVIGPKPAPAIIARAKTMKREGGPLQPPPSALPSPEAPESALVDDRPLLATSIPSPAPVMAHRSLFPEVIPREGAVAHGHTVYPDPERDKRVAAVREQAHVEAVVAEAMAEAKAETNVIYEAVDPAIIAMTRALEQSLNTIDGGSLLQLGVNDGNANLKQNYLKSRKAWAATGDPSFATRNPRTPAHFDAPNGAGGPSAAQLLSHAATVHDNMVSAAPLFSVTLEVVQAASGTLIRAELKSLSGNARFDDFVLTSVPPALAATAPPKHELRALWEVEGWLAKVGTVPEQIVDSLPIVGAFSDQLIVSDPTRSHFAYRARLLKAY